MRCPPVPWPGKGEVRGGGAVQEALSRRRRLVEGAWEVLAAIERDADLGREEDAARRAAPFAACAARADNKWRRPD